MKSLEPISTTLLREELKKYPDHSCVNIRNERYVVLFNFCVIEDLNSGKVRYGKPGSYGSKIYEIGIIKERYSKEFNYDEGGYSTDFLSGEGVSPKDIEIYNFCSGTIYSLPKKDPIKNFIDHISEFSSIDTLRGLGRKEKNDLYKEINEHITFKYFTNKKL